MQYFCNIFFAIPKVLQRTQVFWKLLISFWLNWQHMNCQQRKAVFIWLRTPVGLLTLVQERESSTTSANVPSLFACWSSPPWFSSKETMIFWRYYQYLFWGLCDSVLFFFFYLLNFLLFAASGKRNICPSFFWACGNCGVWTISCRLQRGRCGGNEKPSRSLCSSTEGPACLTISHTYRKQHVGKILTAEVL